MASSLHLFRASILLRTIKLTTPKVPKQTYLYSCRRLASTDAPKQEAQSTPIETPTGSVSTPNLTFDNLADNIKWTDVSGDSNLVNLLSNQAPEITGAIIPFVEHNVMQKIFFMYQYPIMHYLDYVSHQMPWWMAIVATTASIRALFFPLVVKLNIIGIRIYNVLPETQALQVKMNEAMSSGDNYQAALAKTKLKLLFEEHNIKISQRLLPTLVQSPAFLCLFFTLKNLSSYYKLPVLATGGALWFSNLTVPDPYYILPILTSTSMLFLFEKGLEGSSGPLTAMGPMGRWVMRIVPISLFFVFQSFPSAVLLFWTTNNFITLFYAILLRQTWIKKLLNIPDRLKHDPASLPLTNQSFTGQISKSIDKAKGTKTTLDLRKLDDIAFQKAGVGPLRKTYKNPPEKLGK